MYFRILLANNHTRRKMWIPSHSHMKRRRDIWSCEQLVIERGSEFLFTRNNKVLKYRLG